MLAVYSLRVTSEPCWRCWLQECCSDWHLLAASENNVDAAETQRSLRSTAADGIVENRSVNAMLKLADCSPREPDTVGDVKHDCQTVRGGTKAKVHIGVCTPHVLQKRTTSESVSSTAADGDGGDWLQVFAVWCIIIRGSMNLRSIVYDKKPHYCITHMFL